MKRSLLFSVLSLLLAVFASAQTGSTVMTGTQTQVISGSKTIAGTLTISSTGTLFTLPGASITLGGTSALSWGLTSSAYDTGNVWIGSPASSCFSMDGFGVNHTLIVRSSGLQGAAIVGLSESGAPGGIFVQKGSYTAPTTQVFHDYNPLTDGTNTATCAAFGVYTSDEMGDWTPLAEFKRCGITGDNGVVFFPNGSVQIRGTGSFMGSGLYLTHVPASAIDGLPTPFSGAYADLTGKPVLGSAAGQDISAFDAAGAAATAQAFAIQRANQTGTQSASTIGDFATAAQTAVTWSTLSGKPALAPVATSGSYGSLLGLPVLFPSTGGTATNTTIINPAFTGTSSGSLTRTGLFIGGTNQSPATTGTATGSYTFTGTANGGNYVSPVISTPTGILPSDIGLGNVNNTADSAKPVSTAQQTALTSAFGAGRYFSLNMHKSLWTQTTGGTGGNVDNISQLGLDMWTASGGTGGWVLAKMAQTNGCTGLSAYTYPSGYSTPFTVEVGIADSFGTLATPGTALSFGFGGDAGYNAPGALTNKGFGFTILGGVLSGFVHNGTTLTTSGTLATPTFAGAMHVIRMVNSGSGSVQFFVDGVSVGTMTGAAVGTASTWGTIFVMMQNVTATTQARALIYGITFCR